MTAFQNANPILKECEKNIKECILPLVEKGTIPVIAGFLGKTKDGKITTLGRGGSDTTAFILAEAINADQVVLVTDADGIMSGDPKIIASPKRLPEIDVNTLVGLGGFRREIYPQQSPQSTNPKTSMLKSSAMPMAT